jgi:hypothetical protein
MGLNDTFKKITVPAGVAVVYIRTGFLLALMSTPQSTGTTQTRVHAHHRGQVRT